jgi:hypothetical protein
MCNALAIDNHMPVKRYLSYEEKRELHLYKVINNILAHQRNKMIIALAKQFRLQEKDFIKRSPSVISDNAKPFSLKKWNKIIADSVKIPIFESGLNGFNAGINEKKGGYFFVKQDEEDVSLLFTLSNPGIEEWLENFTLVFADTVNRNVQRGLDVIVRDEIKEGGTIEQIRRRIQERANRKYTFIYGKSGNELLTAAGARRMAQTETTKAQNAGHLSGLKENEFIGFKAWLSSRNDKVRPTHTAADGRYTRDNGIPLDENFKVGRSWISSPGTLVSGDVKEIINCFCSVIAARKGRSRGGNTRQPSVRPPKPKKITVGRRRLT